MKRLKIIVLLCLISPFLKGQDYVPFVVDSATWIEEYVIADAGTIYEEGFRTYFILGTYFVDSIEYHYLNMQYDVYYEDWECCPFGLIREENKRIYYMEPPFALGEEVLLHDFNYYLENDSILYDGPDSLNILPVIAIGEVELLNGEVRKKIAYSFYPLYVIEGIGATGLGFFMEYSGLDQSANLLCHSAPPSGIAFGQEVDPENFDYCLQSGSVGVNENHFIQTQIFPNPSKATFRLNLFQEYPKLQIEILDKHGKKVYENQSLSDSRLNINFESSPGIYLMQIFSDGDLIGMEKVMRF